MARDARSPCGPPMGRYARTLTMAAALIAPASALFSAELEYEQYLGELENPSAQYVVVSNHFRHDVGCTSRGCILMGPTTDRDACQEWSRAYNRLDPYDHSRCVESSDYDSIRY